MTTTDDIVTIYNETFTLIDDFVNAIPGYIIKDLGEASVLRAVGAALMTKAAMAAICTNMDKAKFMRLAEKTFDEVKMRAPFGHAAKTN